MNCILVMFLFFSSGPSPQHYTTPLNLVLCTICSVPGSVMIRVILSSCLLVCCLSGDVCLDLERLKQCLLHPNNLLRPPTRPVKREKRTHDCYENYRKTPKILECRPTLVLVPMTQVPLNSAIVTRNRQ